MIIIWVIFGMPHPKFEIIMSKPGVHGQGIVWVISELVGITGEGLVEIVHLLGDVLDDLGSGGRVFFVGLQEVSNCCYLCSIFGRCELTVEYLILPIPWEEELVYLEVLYLILSHSKLIPEEILHGQPPCNSISFIWLQALDFPLSLQLLDPPPGDWFETNSPFSFTNYCHYFGLLYNSRVCLA